VLHPPASALPGREGLVYREEKNHKGGRKIKKNENENEIRMERDRWWRIKGEGWGHGGS
jgi:hypothetical protein